MRDTIVVSTSTAILAAQVYRGTFTQAMIPHIICIRTYTYIFYCFGFDMNFCCAVKVYKGQVTEYVPKDKTLLKREDLYVRIVYASITKCHEWGKHTHTNTLKKIRSFLQE
jgi:hypothetical protein